MSPPIDSTTTCDAPVDGHVDKSLHTTDAIRRGAFSRTTPSRWANAAITQADRLAANDLTGTLPRARRFDRNTALVGSPLQCWNIGDATDDWGRWKHFGPVTLLLLLARGSRRFISGAIGFAPKRLIHPANGSPRRAHEQQCRTTVVRMETKLGRWRSSSRSDLSVCRPRGQRQISQPLVMFMTVLSSASICQLYSAGNPSVHFWPCRST